MADRNSEGVSIELLPLPEWAACDETVADMSTADVREAMADYARANMGPLKAEIEALRAEREVIGAEALKYAGKSGRLEAKVDRLMEALRNLLDDAVRRGVPEDDHSATEAQVALRDHDQEDGD